MIEAMYLTALDKAVNETEVVSEVKSEELSRGGLIGSKVAGRFEIVKKLPEKANSFDEMFDYADAFGKIKFAYIDSAHKISIAPKEKKKGYYCRW
jgi:hypothetical protein